LIAIPERRFGEASAATSRDATSAALIDPPSSARRELPGGLLIRLRPTDHDEPLIRSIRRSRRPGRKTINNAGCEANNDGIFLSAFQFLSPSELDGASGRTDPIEVETTSEALRSVNIYFFV
jgi:hypothetical protein